MLVDQPRGILDHGGGEGRLQVRSEVLSGGCGTHCGTILSLLLPCRRQSPGRGPCCCRPPFGSSCSGSCHGSRPSGLLLPCRRPGCYPMAAPRLCCRHASSPRCPSASPLCTSWCLHDTINRPISGKAVIKGAADASAEQRSKAAGGGNISVPSHLLVLNLETNAYHFRRHTTPELVTQGICVDYVRVCQQSPCY